MKYLWVIVLSVILFSEPLFSEEFKLACPFSDHMVLQSGMPLPVWGTAPVNSEISVSFAGQEVKTKADDKGDWLVKLSSLDINKTPQVLKISCGKETKTLKDVLVGEVWVCSGQSNMGYQVGRSVTTSKGETPVAAAVAKADYPMLRQLEVNRVTSPDEPQKFAEGSWSVCTPESVGKFTAVGFFFARKILQELDVPVGLIHSSWGGTPIESWTPRSTLLLTPFDKRNLSNKIEYAKNFDAEKGKKKIEDWKKKNPKAKRLPSHVKRWGIDPKTHQYFPSTLYNGMIAPLMPYAIRGVIWYQGESNSSVPQGRTYYKTFMNMIKAWRENWGEGEFPFYFVQIANFRKAYDKPTDHGWAYLRESQLRSLQLPKTGMAVTIDIGEARDIHPKNKIDVGERLALWALAKDYGHNVVYSGPLYKSAEFKDGKAIISFTETGGGLMVGEKDNVWASVRKSEHPLKRFQICGKDKKWVWADAIITGKDTIEASSKEVPSPIAVRYAWASNPAGCNLYNAEGLPASPFRTDK